MADKITKVVEIRVDSNEAVTDFNNTSKSIDRVSDSAKKLEGSTRGLGKSILDNGGAMGLLSAATGGLAMDVKDAFEASELFKVSLKGWKAALASTGIGLLVLALGAIVAYWDDIKGAVDGVSASQKRLLEDQKETVKQSQRELDLLNSQDNILKLQGKSEKEILNLKIRQTDETIKQMEVQLEQEKQQLEAQIKASERNKEILSGMLNWINIPLRLLLTTVDQVGKVLGQNFGLVDKLDKSTKALRDKAAGLIFDPEDVRKEGQTAIDETTKTLINLKNQRAGYILSIKGIDQKASDDAKAAEDKKNADILASRKAYLDKAKAQDDEFETLRIERDVKEKEGKETQVQEALRRLGAEAAGLTSLSNLKKKLSDEDIENERIANEAKLEIVNSYLDSVSGGIGILKGVFEKNKGLQKALLIAESAAGIAKIVINTQAANAAAKLKYALVPGGEAIAASIAVANKVSAGIGIAANIAATAKALSALGGGSASGSQASAGGGEGGGSPQAQFNIVGASSTSQLAESVSRSQQQPIQAYVVSSEVTSQQALDRNRANTATFL